MKFLIDQNLPPFLAGWIRKKGFEAEHIDTLGLGEASDSFIARKATDEDWVIVTKDADFAVLEKVSVVWIRLGNATNRQLAMQFDTSWQDILAAFTAGERLVEIPA